MRDAPILLILTWECWQFYNMMILLEKSRIPGDPDQPTEYSKLGNDCGAAGWAGGGNL
jgi:hypothetical protein